VKPRARTSGLVVRELPEETLVYDLGSHRAHCLNRGAALVFRLCDGTRSRAQIAAAVTAQGAAADRAAVNLALAQLAGAGLLEAGDAPEGRQPPAEPSRRRLLRAAGATLLLPAVASVVAPTPAEAATCFFDCIDPNTGDNRPEGTGCNCGGPTCNGICLSGLCTAGC
jgi:hypothetical protein